MEARSSGRESRFRVSSRNSLKDVLVLRLVGWVLSRLRVSGGFVNCITPGAGFLLLGRHFVRDEVFEGALPQQVLLLDQVHLFFQELFSISGNC